MLDIHSLLLVTFYMYFFFFFNDTATTEIYTLSLHDALPISRARTLGLPPQELWRTVRDEVSRLPPVPLSRLVEHVDHVAKVAGIDHVCLGSDFDGIPATPVGLEDASKLPALTAELVRRGYAPGDI